MKFFGAVVWLLSQVSTGVVGQSTKPNIRGELLTQWDRALRRTTESMLEPAAGYDTKVLWTVGETSESGYTPPGIFDGMGAYELDDHTIRVLVNHELLNSRGYAYIVNGGLSLTGARVSYFDVDKMDMKVKDAGLAYHTVYDSLGNKPTDASFLQGLAGFSRFCSGRLVKPGAFASGSGVQDLIYFAPEEDGGGFNSIGGVFWALDVHNGDFWAVPSLGRGAWENLAPVDTGSSNTVGFILADDSSPYDFDGDGSVDPTPLYLYVGTKVPGGSFLERNGLVGGTLYALVTGDATPLDFRGAGNTASGTWVALDTSTGAPDATPICAPAFGGGCTHAMFDQFGYPTQSNLVLQANALGSFGFSRPEDVHENPSSPSTVMLASTGVDSYAIDPLTGNGADTWGTLYAITTDFTDMSATLKITYDGTQDKTRTIRSPDNLVWTANGMLCTQEDEAEEDTRSGDEVLWSGPGVAVNPYEAGIICFEVADDNTPVIGSFDRVANIDRSVVLDPSLTDEHSVPFDTDANKGGEWESSGIIDVSAILDEDDGTYFIVNVQAHGIEDQTDENPTSRINDGDLVEGGQLLVLKLGGKGKGKGKGKSNGKGKGKSNGRELQEKRTLAGRRKNERGRKL